MYKYCLIDLYNTIIKVENDVESDILWQKMTTYYGYLGARYEFTELRDKYHSYIEKLSKKENESDDKKEVALEDVFYRLFKRKNMNPKKKVVREVARAFRAFSIKNIELCPGAIDLLDELKKNDIDIYLVANAQRYFAKNELKYFDLEKYFVEKHYSSDYGVKFPNKKVLEKILEENEIKSKKVVALTSFDETKDHSTKKLGIDTIEIVTNEEKGKSTSKYQISDISEALKIILK